ncbi:acetylglutamate kinase [Galbitalea sp. SE-J8]|uniref:acetylglutamate kinase n=1 Tax=Galbitalea sp. SE-J8 TaxID=3054952 RepID=UPI00259CA1AE|nr:acetylglutamate kinase [Galbitalea sp. SE-J8]MDM4762525.1 acetylglutamate kinase [Galbitalea sp. SE-J8]
MTVTAEQAAQKAAVLVESLPWLQRFHGETIVVKFGGNAMVDEQLQRDFAADMVYLRYAGVRPVVVHGGGPQISARLAQLGIGSEFRGGYRVTTAETIDVIRDVLSGTISARLGGYLDEHRVGPRAPGLAEVIPGETVFRGERRGAIVDGVEVDLGLVGDAVEADTRAIVRALDEGRIPVVSSVARGPDGFLNVNADAAAAALATALGAAKLVVLTDVAGLYSDWPNRDSLVSVIDTEQLMRMLPGLESGMIPKMTACLDAVQGGVAKAAIIDGRQPHSILLEVFTTEGIGTEVVPA